MKNATRKTYAGMQGEASYRTVPHDRPPTEYAERKAGEFAMYVANGFQDLKGGVSDGCTQMP